MALSNLHLTPQLVQAVRDAVDIVAIANEHTRLKQQGKRWGGLCPLHKEKTPSFSVDPDQGLYYCFGCGQGGDAIKLHMQLTGDEFPEAIEALAMRYGIPLPTRGERRSERQAPDTRAVLEAAAEHFRRMLEREPTGREYLRQRKIAPALIEGYQLGYAPEQWRSLHAALHPRFSEEELERAGLIARPGGGKRPYDRFRNRLIFPIHNPAGRLVGFGGRTLGDDKAKYINSSESDRFHKGLLLYGLHQAKRSIRDGGVALLVEGYFDVIGAAACGIDYAVAGMGTALTADQARLLARYAEEVVVGYDGDRAGEQAYRRALPLLLAHGLEVRRARFGEGEDPDSLRLSAGEDAVVRAVDEAEDAVMLEFDRLIPHGSMTPREQSKAASGIGELLQSIPDSIVRFGYSRLAADRLGVPSEMLFRRVAGDRGTPSRSAAGSTAAIERPAAPAPRRETRSLEEQVLSLLLTGAEPIPPAGSLPNPQAFRDPLCRNIYRAFVALYGDAEVRSPPSAQSLLSTLGAEDAVDRLAQILLEKSADPGITGLTGLLGSLEKRWLSQENERLKAEIDDAQRRGDTVRLERLLQEKTSLSRSLHQGAGTRRDH